MKDARNGLCYLTLLIRGKREMQKLSREFCNETRRAEEKDEKRFCKYREKMLHCFPLIIEVKFFEFVVKVNAKKSIALSRKT